MTARPAEPVMSSSRLIVMRAAYGSEVMHVTR